MTYSPVEQGRLLTNLALQQVAARLGMTPAQVALAWVLHRGQALTIPKAGRVAHVRENRAAADLSLSPTDLAELDAAFPRPSQRQPLAMFQAPQRRLAAGEPADAFSAGKAYVAEQLLPDQLRVLQIVLARFQHVKSPKSWT